MPVGASASMQPVVDHLIDRINSASGCPVQSDVPDRKEVRMDQWLVRINGLKSPILINGWSTLG